MQSRRKKKEESREKKDNPGKATLIDCGNYNYKTNDSKYDLSKKFCKYTVDAHTTREYTLGLLKFELPW